MVAKKSDKPRFFQAVHFEKPKVQRGPCPRNRDIFDAVRIDHMSLRAAAEKFGLSKSRIGQIVDQVEGWIGRTGGGPTRTWSEKRRISEYLHRQRLEVDRAKALQAFDVGVELRTIKVVMIEGKPNRNEHYMKNTKGDRKFLELATKIEDARAAFEDDRPAPPEAKDMTAAERIREANLITEEEMQLIEEELEREKEAAKNPTPAHDEIANEEDAAVEQVDHLPAEEDDAEPMEQPALPSLINDSSPADVAEPLSASGRLQTHPTTTRPRRRDPLEGVDLSQYAPLPPAPLNHTNREYPFTPDGLPPPMILIEWPTDEELEQYWALENGRYVFVAPTVLGKLCPHSGFYQRWKLGPPKEDPPRKKRA